MYSLSESPDHLVSQLAFSFIWIAIGVYSISRWLGNQNPREIAQSPVRYFLGVCYWKPIISFAILMVMLPIYCRHRMFIVGYTHIAVVGLVWLHRMLVCGKWRAY